MRTVSNHEQYNNFTVHVNIIHKLNLLLSLSFPQVFRRRKEQGYLLVLEPLKSYYIVFNTKTLVIKGSSETTIWTILNMEWKVEVHERGSPFGREESLGREKFSQRTFHEGGSPLHLAFPFPASSLSLKHKFPSQTH